MIARLRGKVIEAYPNRLVVDVHGVGYEVFIPLSTFDRLHAAEGLEVDLRTHLHFSQLGQKLFGFASEEERDVFLLLIDRVSGVGPTMAVSVLSGMNVNDFKKCVVAGDVAGLSKLKGVGKKTAERIVLELKDKVCKLDLSSLPAADARIIPADDVAEDVISALLNLGYKEPQVRKALTGLDASGGVSVEGLLKQALKILMK